MTDTAAQPGNPTSSVTSGTWVPPVIPTKWEVIPIHNSDRGNFKRCRRYWDWTSPARNNLTMRADIHGVNVPMWFGTGIHYAQEQSYQPGLKRDPVEAFTTWFDIQWRGGVVTEDWLDKVHDLKPQIVTSVPTDKPAVNQHLYKIRGLEDIIPNPDHDEFDYHRELGIKMLEFYKDYAARMDDFEVLIAEHDFSVPIWDYANDCILTAIDMRENSLNYGKELEVHARGRIDAQTVKPNGKHGVLDHKTAAKVSDDEFRKLESDEQCTTYLWAAEVEAMYYDLPHKGEQFEEVIYNVMRKAYAKPPTEIRGGMFSVDREKESTTYPMLMDWIAKNIPGVPLNDKQQGYVDYVRDVGDEQFVIRKHVRRNRHQLKNAGIRMYLEALDMLDPDIRIYPNISNDYACLGCAFRAPCLAKEDGGDWEELIESNYHNNRDR